MQGILFKLLMAVEKYLPMKVKSKILKYFLKSKTDKIFPKSYITGQNVKVEVTPLSNDDLAKMTQDPNFVKALTRLVKEQADKPRKLR